MSALSIFAGPTALARIRDEGINQSQFRVMVGASGGPKWFVLYGLDRYLFGEFFANRQEQLVTLGSSAGAWRMCCLASADPVAAIDRLAGLYSHEQYSAKPTVAEITESARVMLAKVLGPDGVDSIVDNPIFRTHIVTDRCKGLGSSHHKFLQSLALGSSALANAFSRHSLSWFFERTIFNNMGESTPWSALDDIDTSMAALTPDNVMDVMIASGSIPFVLEGVRDIVGAKPGLHWDGGITDYHFDLPFHEGEGLVLYPHFSPRVVPGWFDKHVPWRRVHEEHFHNVVLITPSAEFVAALPGGKIPDRNDFRTHDFEQRLPRWQTALEMSKQLATEFSELVDRGVGLERIQPFSARLRNQAEMP